MGQLRQFVASPASAGLRAFLNTFNDPMDDISAGSWVGRPACEPMIHRRKSISWHDLASREGDEVVEFRQLPLKKWKSVPQPNT